MKKSTSLERSGSYAFVDAMFKDGFDAAEVLEICDEHEMPRLDAVVATQYYVLRNNRKDEFEINCVEAEHYFKSDGTLDVDAYLGITNKY